MAPVKGNELAGCAVADAVANKALTPDGNNDNPYQTPITCTDHYSPNDTENPSDKKP